MMQSKSCTKCKETKSISNFKKSGHSLKNSYASWCKECDNLDHRDRRKNRSQDKKDLDRARMRAYNKQYYYGISIETYNNMLANQNNSCAICGKEETRIIKGTKSSLSIDHCHKSGKLRALLCDVCNKTLGLWKDNSTLFRQAADYLDKWSSLNHV